MGSGPRRLITETLPYDGGRRVSVHLPTDDPVAVVYAGDGALIAGWGAHLEAAGLPPTMIIGVHRTSDPDEMIRIGEYSPTVEPARFAAHERFFVHDVRAWVRDRFGTALPAARTAVAGVSAGAELALATGVRHARIYGVVFAASPGGGYRPPEALPPSLPRVYLTAGTREPFFADNATRWHDALATAGTEVIMTRPDGDHGDPFWVREFVSMVGWAWRS